MVFCLKTHPSLRVYELDIVGMVNSTIPVVQEEHKPNVKTFYKYQAETIGLDKGNSRPHPIMNVIETVCNVSLVNFMRLNIEILDLVHNRNFDQICVLPLKNQVLSIACKSHRHNGYINFLH